MTKLPEGYDIAASFAALHKAEPDLDKAARESPAAAILERQDKLIDAQDLLSTALSQIEAISMAAASLSPDERGPICAVAGAARDSLENAIELLDEYRGGGLA